MQCVVGNGMDFDLSAFYGPRAIIGTFLITHIGALNVEFDSLLAVGSCLRWREVDFVFNVFTALQHQVDGHEISMHGVVADAAIKAAHDRGQLL